jgi:hypothetical protein
MYRSLPVTLLAAIFLTTPVSAGPYSCNGSRSLLDRFLTAEMVVVGEMRNAVGPDNLNPNGQTELWLNEVLKSHEVLNGRKSILMDRNVQSKKKYLVAMDLYKGTIDAYEGVELDDDGIILKFVRGAFQLKDKSALARVRYCIDFLGSPCEEVSRSAHIEIARTDYAELRKIAEKLNPQPLVKALTTRSYPPEQRGSLALLLGHCGKKEDAAIVRKLLDASDPKTDISGLLFAYVLLDVDAGWAYLTKTLSKDTDDFRRRYLAFTTVRRINDERKELVSQKHRDEAMLSILKLPDMADFAIEFFRARNRWDHADTILDLSGKENYDTPLMRRTILRYAMQCPSTRAKAHVNEQQARDPQWVADVAELLNLENPTNK